MFASTRALPRSSLGPEFRKLWAASAASNLGDGVTLVAAPLLAAALTRDPALVAGLAFAQRLPWLLFPLLSGALADRFDRRRIMAAVAVFRAALIGVLGVTVVLDVASIPLLYTAFFLLSAGETLFDVAAVAILPAVVPRDGLPKANARLAGTLTVTNQFVGPPLGGFLFATAAALPFLLGAGGLAAAAALILALPGAFRIERVEGASLPALRIEMAEGIRWLWHHRLLRTLALALALLNITLVAQVSIMVLFAQERLGLGPQGYGVLVAAYGVGGVLGSLVAHRVIARLGAGRTLRIAMLIEAAVPAALALTRAPLLAGAILVFFGVHAVVWGALLTSLRQDLTPARLRGRVESAYRLLEHGGAAPGALLGGLLAAGVGLTAPFWFGAVVGALLIPLVWSTFSDAMVAGARRDADAPASSEN
ncbi:MAG: MFS transporter [Chloroflexi bacterium]|nr:MFS transporter [Chloroflexota bacterium]